MEFKNEHLIRQMDILHPSKTDVPITVIGAGAIGSFTVLALAKMGFSDITVYDFDRIEIENMNCQFYRFKDIGKFKTEALKELVNDFTGVEINAKVEPYERGTFKGIVIAAVDSMKVRKLIWDNHKKIAIGTKFIIDPRMGAETALMYTMCPVNNEDIISYEKSLYSDDDAAHERCTAKATMYTACMLSGLVAKAVKDIVTEGPYPRTTTWSIKDNDLDIWTKET